MADNLDITQGSGTTVATDQVGTAHYQKIKIVDGTADSSNPMLVDATGKLYVHSLTQGTVSISGATGTLGVYLSATAGTIRIGDIPGTISVQFSPSEPTIKGITNTIGVYLSATAGTIRVGDIPGSMAVYFSPGEPTIKGISNSISVYLEGTAGTIRVGDIPGTIAVQFFPSEPTVKIKDTFSTSVIPRTVSGSVTTISASGAQLVAPDNGNAIKVYAIAITTTAQVQTTIKLTNGSGGSPVEYWRYCMQAPAAGIAGANLAVSSPSYLFATAANTTLCITCDNASLVHYSIGYFKEST